jgi:hypothetical protein
MPIDEFEYYVTAISTLKEREAKELERIEKQAKTKRWYG